MKSILILVLLLALCAAAFFTRPTEADFKQYITNQETAGSKNFLQKGEAQLKANLLLQSCTFNNRFLWTDVQQDGKTIYTGAFSHWFNRGQVASGVSSLEHKLDSVQIQKK